MTEPKTEPCDPSNPLKISAVKKMFDLGLIDLRIFFLKIPKFFKLQRLESTLFQSMIGNEKFYFKHCV